MADNIGERFPGEHEQNAGIIRDARKIQQTGKLFGEQKASNETLKMARHVEKVHHERQKELMKQNIWRPPPEKENL